MTRSALLGLFIVLFATQCGSDATIETLPPSTPSPTSSLSLEDAQWAGRWQFDYALVQLEGVAEGETNFTLGSRIRRIWQVTPGCPEGPCNSEILGSDPDKPEIQPARSIATYVEGTYRTTQTFPPEPEQGCRAANGRVIPGAFEASNVVEAKPTKFEETSGKASVTELFAVKTTTFSPTGSAAGAGGTCTRKTAVWEGPVTRLTG
ncbi:MAG: hypothetical protein WD627_02145 [Actinomycetota bacterium]